MRRSLAVGLLIASLAATAACAHPQNIAPKPEESTTTTRPTPPQTTTSSASARDETEQVCAQAQSVSDDAVADLNEKLTEAQSAASAGNNAAALAAATAAKQIATEWKSDLQELARRPIDDDVRDTLEEGIAMIDKLLSTNPQNLNPTQAQRDVDNFLDDLEEVCD